jgi:hypothetical protein
MYFMTSRRNQGSKPLQEVFDVQLIEQRPSYRAGFALYITLKLIS